MPRFSTKYRRKENRRNMATKMKRGSSSSSINAVLLLSFMAVVGCKMAEALTPNVLTCRNQGPCRLKKITCPSECPYVKPSDPNAKACYLDCNSPKCEAVCRGRKAKCNGVGSGCYDPRFIGGDGAVFYFHGRRDEHFSLISDRGLQINARFIGLRPSGRTRDFTWIQALGVMFDSHAFTVVAARSGRWDDAIDHLRFTYDGEPFEVPEGHLSAWRSPAGDDKLMVERNGQRNSVSITVEGLMEASVNVVPVTEEDDKVHGYRIPSDDCFAHLEVQFRFLDLSPKVEGVLGRTYRPDFVNTAKAGVAMPVVGGEAEYMTSSLTSSDCKRCVFSPVVAQE